MHLAKMILIPAIIIVMVTASYFKITDGLKDIVTMKIAKIESEISTDLNKVGQFVRVSINKVSDWIGSDSYNEPGEKNQNLYYVISEDEFNNIKQGIDNIINVGEGGYDDISLKKMLLTHYRGLCTTETTILIEINSDDVVKNLEKDFSVEKGEDLKFEGDRAKKTYLTTEGMVKLVAIKAGSTSEEEMYYLPPELFLKEYASGDMKQYTLEAEAEDNRTTRENLYKYYTILENEGGGSNIGTITMLTYKENGQTTTKTTYNGKTKKLKNNKEDNPKATITKMTLEYYKKVTKYVIPVEFLVDLLDLTGSMDFIDKFSLMQYSSTVKLGIYETYTQDETTATKSYDLKTTIEGTKSGGSTAGASTGVSSSLTKLKNEYPTGSSWTKGQCFGFANQLALEYYGSYADTWNKKKDSHGHYRNGLLTTSWKKSTDKSAVDSIKPGDVLRWHISANNTIGHSAMVIAVDGDTLTLAEANYNKANKVEWGRKVTKSAVKKDHFDYVCIAPYAIGSSSDSNTSSSGNTNTSQTTGGNTTEGNTAGEKVSYTQTGATTTTSVTTLKENNYQMEIIEVDTWYIKITQANSLLTNESYMTWDNKGELVNSDKEKYDNPTTIKTKDESAFDKNSPSEIKNGSHKYLEEIYDEALDNATNENGEFESESVEMKKENVSKTKKLENSTAFLQIGTAQAEDKSDRFLALLKNKSGKYSKNGAWKGDYDPDGKVIGYADIYNGTAYVGDLLENGAEMMFDLLADTLLGVDDVEGRSNTAQLVDVMKYIMWRYTGKDYGVTSFEELAKLLDIDELNSTTGSANDITVKTDKSDKNLVLTKDQILKAAKSYYGGGYSQNINKIIDALMYIQEHYKVNAVFAIAVTTQECGVGKNCKIGRK